LNMKFLIVFVALFAVALAAPSQDQVTVVRQDADVTVDGYKFAYETSDGAGHNAEANIKNAGTENEALSVRGSFKFFGEDGQEYIVNYVADENGFQPEGAHLPVAPVA
ncbi:hypothetical protein KR093_009197, partial [Drosophila rubida]